MCNCAKIRHCKILILTTEHGPLVHLELVPLPPILARVNNNFYTRGKRSNFFTNIFLEEGFVFWEHFVYSELSLTCQVPEGETKGQWMRRTWKDEYVLNLPDCKVSFSVLMTFAK